LKSHRKTIQFYNFEKNYEKKKNNFKILMEMSNLDLNGRKDIRFKELNPRRRVYVEMPKPLEGGAKM
jgi:hypothetical protein